jgi:hypothetical protein
VVESKEIKNSSRNETVEGQTSQREESSWPKIIHSTMGTWDGKSKVLILNGLEKHQHQTLIKKPK